MSQRDATRLVRDLRRNWADQGTGFTVELEGGHWSVRRANGTHVMHFPSTPSDHTFRRNTISRLRRHGVVDRDFR